jgi:hypothetical protein
VERDSRSGEQSETRLVQDLERVHVIDEVRGLAVVAAGSQSGLLPFRT